MIVCLVIIAPQGQHGQSASPSEMTGKDSFFFTVLFLSGGTDARAQPLPGQDVQQPALEPWSNTVLGVSSML